MMLLLMTRWLKKPRKMGTQHRVKQLKGAKKAKAKKLVLTHISARYADTGLLLEQAQKVFKNTVVAEDFMKLELPLLEC